MPPLVAIVKAKAAGLAITLHRAAGYVSSHIMTAVYLLVVAAVAIPVVDLSWTYWKPPVLAYHKRIAAPTVEPVVAKRGRL